MSTYDELLARIDDLIVKVDRLKQENSDLRSALINLVDDYGCRANHYIYASVLRKAANRTGQVFDLHELEKVADAEIEKFVEWQQSLINPLNAKAVEETAARARETLGYYEDKLAARLHISQTELHSAVPRMLKNGELDEDELVANYLAAYTAAYDYDLIKQDK